MIEPRVYRAAFVPAVLVVVLAMFSLESRPRPLPQGLAADVLFDGDRAAGTTRAIVARERDRRPGTVGDRATAAFVEQALERRGFAVEVDEFEAGGKQLANVVARRAGESRSQLLVLAERGAVSVPDATGSAADTAALLELARVFQGRPSRRTLVLASVDGGTLGEVGTRRLYEGLAERELVDAVLVVSNLGSPRRRGDSPIVPWANDASRTGIALERTLADSLRQELDDVPAGARWPGQLFRLAFPIGLGAQGVLLERDVDAVRLSGSGELPAPDAAAGLGGLDPERLGDLGRATLRTLTALDAGPAPQRGSRAYVTVGSQVVPGWVFRLLALALILPVMLASIDAFARARRRRAAVGRWLRWTAASILPFVIGLGVAELIALTGGTPDAAAAPIPPPAEPLDLPALLALAATAAAVAVAWVAARSLLERRAGSFDPAEPGAACATALTLSCAVAISWLVNPFAALLLVPAAHLWMLATLTEPAPRPGARALLVAGGLLLPVALAIYYLLRLSLDPLEGTWYLFLLVTSHHVGLATALMGCVLLGLLGSVVSIALAGRSEPEAREAGPPLRGPSTYAGPGSLGGTDSALRR